MKTILLAALLMLAPSAAFSYDDADPEMKTLLDTFFDLVPCPSPEGAPMTNSGLCPRALALLSGGSDRLATYLIRQYESAIEPVPPISRWTYLRLLGHTESETAVLYLSALAQREADAYAANPADDSALRFALEGLGRTRDLRAIPVAFAVLDRFPDEDEVRLRALGALDRVQAKHGPQPAIRAKLEALAPAAALAGTGRHGRVAERAEKILTTPGATYP